MLIVFIPLLDYSVHFGWYWYYDGIIMMAVSNATDRRRRCTDDCVAQLVSLCPSTPELHSAAIFLAGGTNNSLFLVCRVAQQHSAPRRLQIVLYFRQSKKGDKHHTHIEDVTTHQCLSWLLAGSLLAG